MAASATDRRDPRRFYRFALYGRSGSGKTCVLAKMALGAIGHPGGLTCERLPVVVPKPAGSPSSWGAKERLAAALHDGKGWIDEAVAALRQGKCPLFNLPVFERGTPLTVDFQIGSPERGLTLVRTIDYSGELIHPGEEHCPESLTSDLKVCLQEFDGFLIIGDTPGVGVRKDFLDDELRLLREAFSSLRDDEQFAARTPVAVMFTKWDRYSKIDFEDSASEYDKLDEFLAEHTTHRSLVDSVRNTVGTINRTAGAKKRVGEEPLADDRLAFPSSAFGKADLRDGQELPSDEVRPPFGLLDPFLALADRRDALDAEALEREFADRGAFADWLTVGFRRYPGLIRRAKDLLARMPKGSAASAVVRWIGTSSALRFASCLVGWTVVAGSASDVGYEGVRQWQFSVRRDAVESPQTSDDELLAARKWFGEYRRSRNGFVLAPSADAADNLITHIDTIREENYWSPVVKARDDVERAKAAETYIEELRNGRHVADANQIVRQLRITDARKKNDAWLTRCDNDLRVANDANIKELHDELDRGLPHREVATLEQQARWDKLLRDCGDRLARAVADLVREKFLREYRGALLQNDPVTAAKFLSEYHYRDENWKRLVEEFPGEVASRAGDVVEQATKDRQFQEAKDAVNHARESLHYLELSLRPIEPKLADSVLQGQRDINTIQDIALEAEDQHYYARVLGQRGKASCQEYLDRPKPGAMAEPVRAYQAYLGRLESPMNLMIVVKIWWDKAYGKHSYEILKVRADDRVVVHAKNLQSTPEDLSGEVDRFQLNGLKMSQAITFRADIIEDKWWLLGGDRDAGSGMATFKVSELRDEMRVKLRPTDGSSFENQLRLKIVQGLPQEPELPTWKGR